MSKCIAKCLSEPRCEYVTIGEDGWCMNAEFCNSTGKFQNGGANTYRRPAVSTSASPAPAPPPQLVGVRELASLSSPWFFRAVPEENASEYASSWLAAFDPEGLQAPYGLRTAEKRAKGYFCGAGCCKWSGPMWPFETSKAITAAIHVLNHYPSVKTLDTHKFWTMLWQYTATHTPRWGIMNGVGDNGRKGTGVYGDITKARQTARWLEPGEGLGEFWVAENGCADANISTDSGVIQGPAWTDDATLGYRYNHATFDDLVLSGVVGLVPAANGTLTINPLVPADVLPWWAADGIVLHGRVVSVLFDADGKRYGMGTGLLVLVDGAKAASVPSLSKITVQLRPVYA